jgi:hypothetical protein
MSISTINPGGSLFKPLKYMAYFLQLEPRSEPRGFVFFAPVQPPSPQPASLFLPGAGDGVQG